MSSKRVIPERETAFIEAQRVGHLATSSRTGEPHAVPICFALSGDMVFTPIDEKPKSSTQLRRVRNVLETGRAAVLFHRYEEDWDRLGWVLLRGSAALEEKASKRPGVIEALRTRYPQYRDQSLEDASLLMVTVTSCRSWGHLTLP